jgi:hypothetical protein
MEMFLVIDQERRYSLRKHPLQSVSVIETGAGHRRL